MNLSTGQNSSEQFKFIKHRKEAVYSKLGSSNSNSDFETINLSEIKFGSDETWLYKVTVSPNPIRDLNGWLYSDDLKDEDYCVASCRPNNEFQKNIDSRTFTRPKKRFTRPSIEKYNEEVYGSGSDTPNEKCQPLNIMRQSNDSGVLSSSEFGEQVTSSTKPLSFDLSQPTNSYYFENILANSAEIESFQNMSPPSLVNSMCSSTFANLMESSFIKNDPVLREIRDTDYTESVLLQDSEPPMFQSITESCSSINSDTPESFLKKVSFNGTFRKNASKDLEKNFSLNKSNDSPINLNTTYEKRTEIVNNDDLHNEDVQEVNIQPCNNFNGTYRRTPKLHGTFRKSDINNATLALNSTYNMPQEDNLLDQNSTHTLIKDCSIKSFESKKSFSKSRIILNENTVENMKKQLSETVQITDLNRLSYCLDDQNGRLDSTYTEDDELNRTVTMNRSALGCSTGSADSLDRMSSLSNSSRGSNKMLNMADVDAIVEMQERSLQQVMSTPKPNTGRKKLWENNFISPIISSEPLSDSEQSSNDEYKSVKSTFSKVSLENYSSKPTKSLGYLGGNIDTKMKTTQRAAYTLPNQKPLQVIPNNIRGSYSNLKTIQSNLPGSQPCLYKPSTVNKPTASTTNLKTMGQRLKGSYTSLRPISTNLPVAPPIAPQMNTTTTLPRATNPNVTQNIDTHMKVVEVPPMPREKVNVVGDNLFVKPQQPRASGLPRPTGIPRPASRIPGPRTNIRRNSRPFSSRSANVRRQTNNFQ